MFVYLIPTHILNKNHIVVMYIFISTPLEFVKNQEASDFIFCLLCKIE